jgi:hypothetical protein
LDILAAAYAGVHRFPDAVRTARQALEAAETRREKEAIAIRLREYGAGRAIFKSDDVLEVAE